MKRAQYPSTLNEWRAAGQWIDFEGMRLFTIALGQGEPVLGLHAFPTSSFDYSRIAPLLADDMRLILFDYPGFGFSDKPRRHHYSLFENARAAQAAARHFGVTQCRLIAHDIGGTVALELLRRGQPDISRLCILNGSIYIIPTRDPWMLLRQQALLHPLIGPLISRLRLVDREALRRQMSWLLARPVPDAELDVFWAQLSYSDGHKNFHALMTYMPERWQHEPMWLEALVEHKAPLMLLWGTAAPLATPAIAAEIVRRRPDAVYVPFEGIGHYPHWDAPEGVAQAIRRAFS